MQADSAEALFLAKPPFADIREAPLRIIVSFGSYVFVCRPDFKARHAYLLAQTLSAHAEALPAAATAPSGVVPAHRGAHAFFAGEEMPNDSGRPTAGTSRVAASRNFRVIPACFAVFARLFFTGPRAPSAHEVIDAEQVRAALAAVDAADARAKSAADPSAEGEAKLALGLVQVETTDILNRDLAAHSGRLSFNGDLLQKSLAQRNLSPPFDDRIGRYRLPRATLEDALLAPARRTCGAARNKLRWALATDFAEQGLWSGWTDQAGNFFRENPASAKHIRKFGTPSGGIGPRRQRCNG